MQPTQTWELSCRPGMSVVVLSEFCAPLICRVPFDATVEDVKAGFICRSSVACKRNPSPRTGAMVANDEAAVDTRHLLYDRLQASTQGKRLGTSAG